MNTHVLTILLLIFALPSGAAARWWECMGDSVLNNLERRALEANYDVDAALRRVEIARSALAAAQSGYYPDVAVSAGWEKERSMPSAWSLNAQMRWEIDVFGRVRASARKGEAGVRVSRAELEGSRLNVAAAVAAGYVQLRMHQASLELARRQADDQQKVADMVQTRYDAGLANRLEVAQSLTTVFATRSTIPGLESAVAQSLSAIATLLGVQSSALEEELAAVGVMPSSTDVLLPAQVPADDVRARPDVVAAEAQIDAAAASLGIARKEYLPSLTLDGSVSTSARSVDKLFCNGSFSYSVAPTLSWTVFDGLARRAGVREARERLRIAVDNYNSALLTGYEEVKNALVAYNSALQTAGMLSRTVEQCEVALEKSIDLYKLDLADFTDVMQSQMSLLTYRTRLIEAEANVLASFVSFHKALGK